MNNRIIYTTQFKKDYRLAIKRNFNISLLDNTIRQLHNGEPLSKKHRNHHLSGIYSNCQECHILPDWLLIYTIDSSNSTIILIRTGTHSDLFKK